MAKRSSWASGSGYVPWNSTGFCVAITTNGGGKGYVRPSMEACPSLMASSRLDCVLGDARLISSPRRMLVKIGPFLNVKLPSLGL